MGENLDYLEIFGVSKSWLDEMFPFHFVLDEWGGVLDAGPFIPKIVDDLEWEMALDNFFEYSNEGEEEDNSGNKEITQENLLENSGKCIELVGKMVPLKLRGEVRNFPDKKRMIFLGTPKITKANQLTRYGIKITDLPLSDPTRNFLELIEGNSAE